LLHYLKIRLAIIGLQHEYQHSRMLYLDKICWAISYLIANIMKFIVMESLFNIFVLIYMFLMYNDLLIFEP